MSGTSSGSQIRTEVVGDKNVLLGGNYVGGDFNITVGNIYLGNEEVGGEAREKLLEEKVAEYKNWITEEENDSKLRSKLDQLKIEDRKCFVERKFRKEKKEKDEEKENNPTLTTSELLDSLPRSKTTLVSAPSGSGKSTLAASITEQWAKSEHSSNQFKLVLFLSSLQTTQRSELSKLVWGEFASRKREDSKLVYQELEEMKDMILIIIDGLDEIKLDKKMISDATIHASDVSEKIDLPTLIVGILTKKILPNSTVLGFSRSGDFLNRDLLKGKAEVFTITDLDSEDVKNLINMALDSQEQREAVLKQIEKIDEDLKTQILFVKEILKLSLRGKIQFQGITSASELFLSIILGNLQYQDPDGMTGYSELSTNTRENLKITFKFCKDNLQKHGDKNVSDGVLKGTKVGEDCWKPHSGDQILPLIFLKSLGMFEIPPPDAGHLTLTATHLSFVEFSCAAGIILSSDIASEMKEIENEDRFKAVSVYISEMLTKKSNSESRLDNFRKCLGLSGDSSEDLLQELYSSLMKRTLENPGEYITLVKHKFLPFIKNKINISPRPLLACIAASGVPVNNIKKIQARLERISEKDWEALHLQSETSLLDIEETGFGNGADYSPRISEMLGSGRLTQFRAYRIRCVSPLTDCQELSEIVKKSGAEYLHIYLDKNSPDTVKKVIEQSAVRVGVKLNERGGGCTGVTFSPHTDNINMRSVTLLPGEVTRLTQLLSLSQSWTVRGGLLLCDLGPEDWTELHPVLETLVSVKGVKIRRCSPPPSVSLLETLWDKTEEVRVVREEEEVDDEEYYKENAEDFTKLVTKYFQ